jgi:hypothetical protein
MEIFVAYDWKPFQSCFSYHRIMQNLFLTSFKKSMFRGKWTKRAEKWRKRAIIVIKAHFLDKLKKTLLNIFSESFLTFLSFFGNYLVVFRALKEDLRILKLIFV